MNKSIGIIANSNDIGGGNKLIAMIANDLSNDDRDIYIYIPILPFKTYYVTFFKKSLYWFLKIAPGYFLKWLAKKPSSLDHLLDKSKILNQKIKIKSYLYKPDKLNLKRHEKLIINGIGTLIDCQNIYPQNKQIYIIHMVEEISHGLKFTEKYKNIRRNFKGRVLTHSNFTKKMLSDHLSNVAIVPNPISPNTWKFRDKIDLKKDRKDLIVYCSNQKNAKITFKILEEILKLKNDIKFTILLRSSSGYKISKKTISKINEKIISKNNAQLLFDLSEEELVSLFISHSFILYPNVYESFGMPPVEGLACGCVPILRPNVGAADMYAVDNFNSIYLTDNINDDAYKIVNILKNKEKIYELRSNSSKNIDQFNPENYGQRILKD